MRNRDIAEEQMTRTLTQDIVTMLAETDLVRSRSAARRLVALGGVSVDGARISEVDHVVDRSRSVEVVAGRRTARLTALCATDALAFTESSVYSAS